MQQENQEDWTSFPRRKDSSAPTHSHVVWTQMEGDDGVPGTSYEQQSSKFDRSQILPCLAVVGLIALPLLLYAHYHGGSSSHAKDFPATAPQLPLVGAPFPAQPGPTLHPPSHPTNAAADGWVESSHVTPPVTPVVVPSETAAPSAAAVVSRIATLPTDAGPPIESRAPAASASGKPDEAAIAAVGADGGAEAQYHKGAQLFRKYLAQKHAGDPQAPSTARQALPWLLAAARSGFAKASYQAAMMHELGLGISVDLQAAADLYHQAAVVGHVKAMYMVAYGYHLGMGVPQDLTRAIRWYMQQVHTARVSVSVSRYRKAAAFGHPIAAFNLGLCYKHGWGEPTNLTAAEHWFRISAERHYTPGMVDLAALLYSRNGTLGEGPLGESPKHHTAKGWFEEAADNGNSDAQYDLGLMLQSSKKAEACEWFAKSGDTLPCAALARSCECLDPLNQTLQETCVEKAAARGDVASQNNLAAALVGSDSKRAVALWTDAAAAGLKEAQFNLALALEQGTGGAENLVMARFWYGEAAKQEDASATFNLGTMLEAGRGGARDPTVASENFAKARALGVTSRVKVPNSGVVPEITAYEISRDSLEA